MNRFVWTVPFNEPKQTNDSLIHLSRYFQDVLESPIFFREINVQLVLFGRIARFIWTIHLNETLKHTIDSLIHLSYYFHKVLGSPSW